MKETPAMHQQILRGSPSQSWRPTFKRLNRPLPGTTFVPAGTPGSGTPVTSLPPAVLPPTGPGGPGSTVPLSIGTPSYPQQWQSQQALQVQQTPVNVSVVTQPEVSSAFPARDTTDYGPMASFEAMVGAGTDASKRCLWAVAIGAGVAWLWHEHKKQKHGHASAS